MTEEFDVICKEIQRLVKHLGASRAIFAIEYHKDNISTYWFTHPNASTSVSEAVYLCGHLIHDIFTHAIEDKND